MSVCELCVSLVFLEHMGPLSRVAFCTRKVLLMCDLIVMVHVVELSYATLCL
jgi:hypothetical protein